MRLDEVLEFNRRFVENEEYGQYGASKLPSKNLVVISCMDTRLVELLPKAMNLKNGDAIFLRVAGVNVWHPFGSIMRSILVAIYELNAHEICVVGHHDCGMSHINPAETLEKMVERGISRNTLETIEYAGININNWLRGFDSVTERVQQSVNGIKSHPLIPKDIPIHGMVIHPETGALELVVNGHDNCKIPEKV